MHKQSTKSSLLGSSFSQVLIHWRGAFMYFTFSYEVVCFSFLSTTMVTRIEQLTKSGLLWSSFSQVLIHWRGAFMYFRFLFNDSVLVQHSNWSRKS